MVKKIYKQVVLVVLDGFGVAPAGPGNAISLAHTPNFDKLVSRYGAVTVQASGPLVGLPWGEMGNSEVGHLNMGAGRIVGQDLPRITTSIQSGDFFRNPALVKAASSAAQKSGAVHLVGMVSGGGVHSLDEHCFALLGLCAEQKVQRVYVHMFTDGRDTEQKVAEKTLERVRAKFKEVGLGEIATVTGRFWGMDRGQHWNQTAATFDAIVAGTGHRYQSAEECVKENYAKGVFDEMIEPSVMVSETGEPVGPVRSGDSVIFFNFRSDRALQLAQLFTANSVVPKEFARTVPEGVTFAALTQYAPELGIPVAFEPVDLRHDLAEVISTAGLPQFHIAETEKYAHVTAFFNCGRVKTLPGETWEIIDSPENSSNYVDKPEMSAPEVTKKLCAAISDPAGYRFIVANFANGDMVGHTGNLQAAVKAVESLDTCIGAVAEASLAAGSVLLVTADHGNCEQMLNVRSGEIDKDHTTSPVPLLYISQEREVKPPLPRTLMSLAPLVPEGVISDIAPTVLDLLGLTAPQEMTGQSLVEVLER